ncbi:MAG: hypothetical protein HY436_00465, partial [Candidatus Liptonbacteria bacterium]|nr:hypothetical protein [Candidatus Liptonbacteria bacterium]
LNPDDVRTVEELEKEVAVFNSSVRVIQRVRQELNVKHLVFEKIGRFAAEERITVTKLEFHGFGISAMLGGEGESESRAIAFKKRIEDDPQFQRVNLPLDSVQVRQGSVLFSMDFVVSALIAE